MAEKACYRFVPLNSKVVPGPLAFDQISHSRPLRDCWSGSLTVEWKNETPICVGMPVDVNGEKIDSPFHLPGKRFALPGPSLKGMIRSVLEIATFSHLGRINAQHHFGYRDYNDLNYKERVAANTIKAGWLTNKAGEWFLAAAGPKGDVLLAPIYLLLDEGLNPHRLAGLDEAKADAFLRALTFNDKGRRSNSYYNTLKINTRMGWDKILATVKDLSKE